MDGTPIHCPRCQPASQLTLFLANSTPWSLFKLKCFPACLTFRVLVTELHKPGSRSSSTRKRYTEGSTEAMMNCGRL